jgi:DNA-binding SARP family transcriptional activator
MASAVDFRILGPLEIAHGSEVVHLRAAKERAILAMLLVSGNRVVTIDQLIDGLWGDSPPASADVSTRVHVSRLRKTLAGLGAPDRIVTRAPGYLIQVKPDELDAARFERLVALGRQQLNRGETADAAATLAEALSLWRGPALADLASAPFAAGEAARLEEARLSALEDRLTADLALGREAALLGELERLVAAHPLRERLWAARMIALYRVGRQAEALRVYQTIRRRLANELGIDPGPELSRLESAILSQSPGLLAPVDEPAFRVEAGAQTVARAPVSDGPGAPTGPAGAAMVVSAELPGDPASGSAGRAPAAAAGPVLPMTGIITFLVVSVDGDVEGSGRLRDTIDGILRAGTGRIIDDLSPDRMAAFRRASEAVDAAVHIRETAATHQISVRIAIDTGEAQATDGGYTGPAATRARRLHAATPRDRTLLSRATAELVRDHLGPDVELEDLGRVPVPGSPLGEWVFSLLAGVRPGTPWPEEPPTDELFTPPLPPALQTSERTPFVNRVTELQVLETKWRLSTSGEGHAVLIAGEPGIGKTHLVSQLGRRVHAGGGAVLYGRCDEDLGVPYQPFVEALGAYVRACPTPVLRTQIGRGAGELARLVPELADRVPVPATTRPSDPELERSLLFDSISRMLAAVSTTAPVLLVLDDLQWAARPTLLLLRHLVRSNSATALMIVGGYRDTELDRSHPLSAMLADLRRDANVERLQMRGLDVDAVGELVALLTSSMTDGEQAPAGLVEALHGETDGNPFWIVELVAHLAETGGFDDPAQHPGLGHDVVSLPEGVRNAVTRRLSRLSETTNRVLTVASVVGREFDVDVLERVPDLGVDPDALLDGIDEALTAKIIIEDPQSPGRYSFTHSLLRQALYSELSGARRVRLHRYVADALEQLPGQTQVGVLAYHALQGALGGGSVERAVEYAMLAGAQASAMLAHEEAVAYYDQALSILELAAGRNPLLVCDLLLAKGEAENRSGEANAAAADFERAATLARDVGDAERLARAALMTGPLSYFGVVGADAKQIDILEEARQELGPEHTSLQIMVAARLALLLSHTHERPRASQLSIDALELARVSNDPRALGYALSARLDTLAGTTREPERAALASELLALGERIGDDLMALHGQVWLIIESVSGGDMARMDAAIAAYRTLAERGNHPLFLSYALMLEGMSALLKGDIEAGERLAAEALVSGQPYNPLALAFFGAQLFWTWWQQGRLPELEQEMVQIIERAPDEFPAVQAAVALMHADGGRVEEARALFDQLAADDFAHIIADQDRPIGLALLSAVCAALGDPERARLLYDLLQPMAGTVLVTGQPPGGVFGPADLYRGVLAATMGDLDGAVVHLEAALALAEGMNAGPFVAWTQSELGTIVLASGDTERGIALLRTALEAGERLGLARVERRARKALGGTVGETIEEA